jgi:hypothetical protein
VPHDVEIDAHGVEGIDGILEALALGQGRGLREKLTTSAERRLAASSNDMRVRVVFLEKECADGLALSVGSFL